jgi:hypothetical protein
MARTADELKDISEDFRNVIDQMIALFTRTATATRARATHSTGTAAKGIARIIVPLDFPSNDFLQFGKTYGVVLRHATPRPAIPHPLVVNPDTTDDRMLDGGAVSIKFFETERVEGEGLHDVMMNTGRVLFVPSARAFNRMIHTPFGERGKLIEDGDLDDDLLTEAYRTGSFTEFYYHSQIAFEILDKNGVLRYIKFRLIPGDRGPERGLFRKEQKAGGDTFAPAWPDDERDPKYRRHDFEVRVRHIGVQYIIQAQLHDNTPNIDLSPMVYWNERNHPWVDVAQISLSSVLTAEEQDKLSFDANRTHDSINLPLTKEADAPESIGHSRALVYWHAREARRNAPSPHRV